MDLDFRQDRSLTDQVLCSKTAMWVHGGKENGGLLSVDGFRETLSKCRQRGFVTSARDL